MLVVAGSQIRNGRPNTGSDNDNNDPGHDDDNTTDHDPDDTTDHDPTDTTDHDPTDTADGHGHHDDVGDYLDANDNTARDHD